MLLTRPFCGENYMKSRFFVFVLLMVCAVHPTISSAQSGNLVFADQVGVAPLENSGDFTSSILPFIPPAKSLVVPKFIYSSGIGVSAIQLKGWSLQTPFVANNGGAYKFFDGSRYHPLIAATQANTYFTAQGQLF
jgi:hypothetical protein